MKKTNFLLLAIVMMLGTLTMYAQKPFAGKVVFEMRAEGTDDPNIAAELADAVQEVTLMGNNTKTVMSQPGFDYINITNGDYKIVTTVVGITGIGKYYVEQKAADIEKALQMSKFDYTPTGDTKDICGYNCKKVNVKVTDLETDEEKELVVWVTDELNTGENVNFTTYPGLKGYPLSMEVASEINGENVTLVQIARSVTPDKKVKASSFLRPADAQPLDEAPEDVKNGLKQMLGMGE